MRPIDDPICLFEAAQQKLQAGDWLGVAALCDAASLTLYKRQLLDSIMPKEPVRALTADDLLKHNPAMPREVAEYQVARIMESSTAEAHLRHQLGSGIEPSDVERMSPAEVFARWLRVHSPQHQAQREREEGRIAEELFEQISAGSSTRVPVGVAYEGEVIARVLYRFRPTFLESKGIADPEDDDERERQTYEASLSAEERQLIADGVFDPPQVTTCRRQNDGTWRLVADHGFMNAGNFVIVHSSSTSAE